MYKDIQVLDSPQKCLQQEPATACESKTHIEITTHKTPQMRYYIG
jgi:hypothetical protein